MEELTADLPVTSDDNNLSMDNILSSDNMVSSDNLLSSNHAVLSDNILPSDDIMSLDNIMLSDNIASSGNIMTSVSIDIKQEPQDVRLNEQQDAMVQIKFEEETPADSECDLMASSVDVKEEITIHYEKTIPENMEVNSVITDKIVDNQVTKMENVENEVGVKQEMMTTDDTLVSYDFPSFDDTQSMDSNDIAVLGNVETCLQEELHIKPEIQDGGEDQHKDEFHHVKQEAGLVTETHLISNKLISTTSTVTNPQDGLIESQTTNTLVMEILPVPLGTSANLSRMSNPEEILPTTYDSNMDCDDMFQLNSITGNVLSLEQEAYGLLKAKKNIVQGVMHPCLKCSKEFKTPGLLKRHMGVHQSIEKRAKGFIKGQQTRKANRKKQLELENDDFPVSIKIKKEESCDGAEVKSEIKKEGYECTCGKIFQRRSRMETCLRSHSMYSDENPCHQCSTCLKQFYDKNELASHRKRSHRKRFHCKFCPTDYNTRKELFKHLQAHQRVQLMEYKVISEVVKGKQKLRCFMCQKSYGELSELKSHVMEDHSSPYRCLHCKNKFAKIIEFGDHMKTYHPNVGGQSVLDVLEAFSLLVKAWKCEECGLQFHEADKLALHQIEQHGPDLKADPQFQCPDCRRVFINQKGLTSHRRVHHSEVIEESEPAIKGIMCLECRKICKDEDALTSHMRLHSPERKYPCKFCDFRFSTPEKRKAHAELHTGDMKFVCFICEYQCSSENRLKQHKASVKHLNMKEYLASGTWKQEQSSSEGGEKRKEAKKEESDSGSDSEVACDICGDAFATEREMLEHKQTHPFIEFPNDDKPSRIFFK